MTVTDFRDPRELPPLDPDLTGWDAVVIAIRKLTRSASDDEKEADVA